MNKPLVAAEPVSAYDAKTHLPKLLERVENGERFVITRHGRPVAQLVPYQADDADALAATFATVADIRAALHRQGFRIASLLEAGESVRDLTHRDHRY